MRLPPNYEAALIKALHLTTDGAERWAGASQIDDHQLRVRISEEFGIAGGFAMTGTRVEYWGGLHPEIEIQIGEQAPITLSGRKLLSAVRDALKLQRPGELF